MTATAGYAASSAVGDGDGWVRCTYGHRHWGRFGAAGLLLAGERGAMLQHRAPWTHEGGTWGVPGGARDSHEDVVATALREASEEAAVEPGSVAPLGWWVDDHRGWSYTTVVARQCGPVHEHARNAESVEIRWWAADQVASLPLHHGFAATWPILRSAPEPLAIVVDSANVVGSRPDGWWRDRAAAARRLRRELTRLARHGLDAANLPDGVSSGGLSRMLPRIVLVVEGEALTIADEPGGTAWWDAAVTVAPADRDGDAEVVRQAARLSAAGAQTVAVTADRGLRARLPDAVIAEGPRRLIAQLPVTEHPARS